MPKTCGRASVWVLFVLVMGLGRAALASTLTVFWDPSPDLEVTGYVVSYGTQAGVHPIERDVGTSTSLAVSGLTDGVTYYFVVQAYDAQGHVSVPSEEASGVAGALSGRPLIITCPAPSVTSYDGGSLAMVFSPVVSGGTPPVTTVCLPPSGTVFPVGTTTILCTATDVLGTTASCSATATVVANKQRKSGS